MRKQAANLNPSGDPTLHRNQKPTAAHVIPLATGDAFGNPAMISLIIALRLRLAFSLPLATILWLLWLLLPHTSFGRCFRFGTLLVLSLSLAAATAAGLAAGATQVLLHQGPQLGRSFCQIRAGNAQSGPQVLQGLGQDGSNVGCMLLVEEAICSEHDTQSDGNFVTHILWASKLADRDLSMVEPGQDIYIGRYGLWQ